jgi:hypothetical protein
MPFETSFDPPRRLMITHAWGYITLDDLRAYQQELAARPEFDPAWEHVFAAGGAVQFDMSSEEIRHLAATSVLAREGARWSRPTWRSLASSACKARCSNFRWTDRRSGCARR